MAKLNPENAEDQKALEAAYDFIIETQQEMAETIKELKAKKKELGFGNRRKYAKAHGITVEEVKALEQETAKELRKWEAHESGTLPKLAQFEEQVNNNEISDELSAAIKGKKELQAEKVAKDLADLEVQRSAAKVQHGGLSYDELKLQVEAAQRGITAENVDQPLAVIQGIQAMGDQTKAVNDYLFSQYAEEVIVKGKDSLDPIAKTLVDELAHKSAELYTDKLAAHYGIEKTIELDPSLEPAGPSLEPAGPSLEPAGPSLAPAGPSVAPAGPSVAPAGPSVAPAGPSVAPAGPSVAPEKTPADFFKTNRPELLKSANMYSVQSLYYETLLDAIEQKQRTYMEANGGIKAEPNLQDYYLVCEKMVDQLDKQAEALNILNDIKLNDPKRFAQVVAHNEEVAKLPGYKDQIARLEAEKAGLQKALATDSIAIREAAVDKAIKQAERILDRCIDPEKTAKYKKQIKELKGKKGALQNERQLNEENKGKIEKDIAGLEESIARVKRNITRIENTDVPDVFMAGGKMHKVSELTATIATAEKAIEEIAKQGQFRSMEKAVSTGKFRASGDLDVRESAREALSSASALANRTARTTGVKTEVHIPKAKGL